MRYLSLLIILFFAVGCSKDRKTYTIKAYKENVATATLELDDAKYTFQESSTTQDFRLDRYDVVSASLQSPTGISGETLTLELYKGDKMLDKVSGDGYIWMVISRDDVSKGGGFSYSGGSGGSGSSGGSSSATCPCGAPTKDGTPCKRMVKGCGRCWQHK